jgi:hypothetical protein
MSSFKSLILRNGGNCAFTAKFNDAYWQSLIRDLNCGTLASRPCVVYLNGEYWGLYVMQEDYSEDYFNDHYGVDGDKVILYKGDGEKLALGYALDLGKVPKEAEDESCYLRPLLDFFANHKDLKDEAAYKEFSRLVDVKSARDYFAVQCWINNKWDWPNKNWSMWKTAEVDPAVPLSDGRWRFCWYDIEFGGVSGRGDAYANTIKEDNYKPRGLLDMDTTNPAVLTFAYLMTNARFRVDFNAALLGLSQTNFSKERALRELDRFKDSYGPLYAQFFLRYPESGDENTALYGGYASYACVRDFLLLRADNIKPMVDWVNWISGIK